MSLLPDTHALLWCLAGVELAGRAVAAIGDGARVTAVSAVSIWEAEIKAALGKLHVSADLTEEAATVIGIRSTAC